MNSGSMVERRLSTILKSQNLPTRAVMARYKQQELAQMTDKGLLEILNRERTKLMLLSRKIRQVKGDLKKKIDNLNRTRNILEKRYSQLEFSQPNKTNLKKITELRDRMKSLDERSERYKSESYQVLADIVSKTQQIEHNLKLIEKTQVKKALKK